MNTSNQTYRPRFRTFAALSALALTSVFASSASAVIVDGHFDPNEGYTNVQSLFFQLDNGTMVKDTGTLAWSVDSITGNVFIAFVQPLSINDNTYGANSVGWVDKDGKPKGHTFGNLTGSDKAQFNVTNGAGQMFLYTLDYISQSNTAPSGYASLGVAGGDGGLASGSKNGPKPTAADVLKWGSSLDYNLNILGFKTFTVDSPATTPVRNPDGSINYGQPYANPANAPGWVYNIEYEFEIAASAFGPSGFGSVTVPFAHDSPSKFGQNTIIAVPEATNYLMGLAAIVFAGVFHFRQVQLRRKLVQTRVK
ncbi:MAG TPA: hypothetical protein VJ719_11665 [Chthoniobacterales bacterium]|nr:hypothetical protein [Chthoniobacterales bacterium]